MNLQASAYSVKYKAVWIVSTTTTVPHVMNLQTTSSPTTVSARSVPLKDALIALTPPTVPLVMNRTTIFPSKMAAENAGSLIAMIVRVGTSVRIVAHGPISVRPTGYVSIGS